MDEVIFYETQLAQNDSILSLASLSKKEQQAYVNAFIKSLKEQDDKRKAEGE